LLFYTIVRGEFCLFYDNLKKECEKQGMKITPLILECGGTKGVIGGWKNGASPNSDIVMKLSVRLKVPTDYLLFGKEKSPSTKLKADEQELLTYYNKLPKEQQLKTLGRLEALAEMIAPEPVQEVADTIYIEMYSLPVSAGTGIYLDCDDKDMIEVESNAITRMANFALRIAGDSMEPKFSNGDVVLIKTQPCVDIGDVGVFIFNDEGYIKQFGGDRLISLNDDYDDILLHEYDSFCCKGKVIGKL